MKTMPKPGQDCTAAKSRKQHLTEWARFAGISIASGSIPAVIEFTFGHPTWQRLLEQTASGFLFASCIGGLCWLVLPRIAGRILRFPYLLKIVTLVSVISLLAAVGCAMASVILVAIGIEAMPKLWNSFVNSFKLSLLITLVFGMFSFFRQVVITRLDGAMAEIAARKEAEEKLQQVATEARLSSLESRVQPHFLFNTLNSILALIREDPAAAERMVEQLAALLRFSLDANQSRLVPLSLEAKIVRDYLEIERARFGSRLRYTVDIPAAFAHVPLPPMSLQTLVENSVKYAVSPRREGAAICVSAQREGHAVRIAVTDDGPGMTVAVFKPGHGLELLQHRLDGLFGPEAQVTIETPTEGGTRVSLRLPFAPSQNGDAQPELAGVHS